jgi:hypothetical protein
MEGLDRIGRRLAMTGAGSKKRGGSTFDYRILRLLVGGIAFAIPIVVIGLAYPNALESISASYYTNARDAFVGMLFVVAAFLIAYRGHTASEGSASSAGALAAVVVATFPTSTIEKPDLPSGLVHYVAAAALFLILVYFCFVFWKRTHNSERKVERRRARIYAVCGIVMLASIISIATAKWFLGQTMKGLQVTFWGETIALLAFGIAWIVAGKTLPYLSDRNERPQLLADFRTFLSKGPDRSSQA